MCTNAIQVSVKYRKTLTGVVLRSGFSMTSNLRYMIMIMRDLIMPLDLDVLSHKRLPKNKKNLLQSLENQLQ